MSKITLDCSMAQFQELHEIAARPKGDTIKVSKASLSALLRDHGKLYDALKNEVTHAEA